MYSVKSGGRSVLVGSTIGAFACGIGMRHRETFAEVVDRRPDPYDELALMRRCVLPQAAVRALVDIGVSKPNLQRILTPAKRWKFITTELVTMREVDTYTGCSPTEPVFHCTEGDLLRMLRRDFMRFGGVMHWECHAHHAERMSSDGDGNKWMLHKNYGPVADAEVIVSFAKSHDAFRKQLVVNDPDRFDVLFDQRRGVCKDPSKELLNVFGKDFDVLLAIGHGAAIHLWKIPNTQQHISFNMIVKGRTDSAATIGMLHPALASVVSGTMPQALFLPGTAPAIKDEARFFNIGIAGESILPVDPFEWRGDFAMQSIEEASMMIRALYGNKFHRGNVAMQLREMEQDSIVRRANVLKRDLTDAEHFLAVNPVLPRDEDEEPEQIKRIIGGNVK